MTSKRKEKRWFPLESNPDLLNKYVSKLGFDTSKYSFVDVFSTEDWAIDMIPQPAAAVLMLYPITDAQEAHRSREAAEVVPAQAPSVPPEIWHVKQRIGNACGTVGILHAIANSPRVVRDGAVTSGSWLDRYYARCPPSASPDAKADELENDSEIEERHDEATSSETNATERGDIDDGVDTHFAAFANVGGGLWELDGRKKAPIRHGDTDPDAFLRDACGVVRKFMERDPGEMRFTILALAPNQGGG